MRLCLLRAFVISLVLSGCTTRTATQPTTAAIADLSGVDLQGLKRELRLEGSDLGYFERGFETCQAGYGFSRSQDCRALRLVVIRFQLLCRTSEGTETSAESYQTFPVAAADLGWRLAGQSGGTRTDSEGRAEIALAAGPSPREQRLRLIRGNDFLLITAEDVRRIVAGKDWCTR